METSQEVDTLQVCCCCLVPTLGGGMSAVYLLNSVGGRTVQVWTYLLPAK